MSPALLPALALAAALPAQNVTWRFSEDNTPTCPSLSGHPCIEDSGGTAFVPQHSSGPSVSITWHLFTPGRPVMLLLSAHLGLGAWPPCVLIGPDLWLVSTTNQWGECRFMWGVPLNPPLSVVPLGTATLGTCQVIELSTAYPSLVASVSSYAVLIESVR